MKILSFEYHDKVRAWHLNPITFKNLSLLVGVSGVGKTQILEAIDSVRKIASGASIKGVYWKILFTAGEEGIFEWSGEFNGKDNFKNSVRIMNEKLSLNSEEIVYRNEEDIFFKGKKTVKLSPNISFVYLLKEEKEIDPIYKNFNLIKRSEILDAYLDEITYIHSEDLSKPIDHYNNYEKIKNSSEEIWLKLYLLQETAPVTFNEIKNRLIEFFPTVKDLKITRYESVDENFANTLNILLSIQILESNIWVNQNNISSGMLRVLLHFSELYLSPVGTVFLIDEFENSLGVNCLDLLTDEIIKFSNQFQFIITSHHPYIINKIDMANWKIITREGSTVQAYDADELNLGNSKHDSFLQLLNNEKFLQGVG